MMSFWKFLTMNLPPDQERVLQESWHHSYRRLESNEHMVYDDYPMLLDLRSLSGERHRDRKSGTVDKSESVQVSRTT